MLGDDQRSLRVKYLGITSCLAWESFRVLVLGVTSPEVSELGLKAKIKKGDPKCSRFKNSLNGAAFVSSSSGWAPHEPGPVLGSVRVGSMAHGLALITIDNGRVGI